MVPYNINMARGRVVPASVRKRWYRWLLAYFVVALTVAGVSVAFVTSDLVDLNLRRVGVERAERRFLGARAGVRNLADCLRSLSQDMATCQDRLEGVANFQGAGRRTAGVLLGLVEPLPVGLDVGQVEIDAAGGRVSFEVHAPAGRQIDEASAPPHLITLWSASPWLAGQVSRLTAEKSEHVRLGGQDLMSWRFTGVLGGGN